MKTHAFGPIFGRRARDPYEEARGRYIAAGMTRDMADLLVTMLKLTDLPTSERLTTHQGRKLWGRYLRHCTKVDRRFEALVRVEAFDEFRAELNRLAALAQVDSHPERTEASHDSH